MSDAGAVAIVSDWYVANNMGDLSSIDTIGWCHRSGAASKLCET